MNTIDKNEQPLPTSGNSALFGTTSTDILQGLHQNAFTASSLPDDDDQIVNEEDQQEIVNPTQEDLPDTGSAAEGTGVQQVPGIEKDLLDKNILEEGEVPDESDTNDIKAS